MSAAEDLVSHAAHDAESFVDEVARNAELGQRGFQVAGDGVEVRVIEASGDEAGVGGAEITAPLAARRGARIRRVPRTPRP